ncbi:MAG: chromosomal replication initiator protein DnaA [Leptospiraceae bacterium]|nr:chromosomal replication initiator protein DnaA [Leptospiraceae bacterium]
MSILREGNLESIWPKILDEVSKQIPAMYFDPFISPLLFVECSEENLIIKAPSVTIKNHVEKKYQSVIADAAEKIGGLKLKIQIHTDSNDTPFSNFIDTKFKEETFPFNPDYTMDKFVLGDCNRMAFMACKDAIENPGNQNPIYIHGKVSVGKTYLLHAVGNSLTKMYPNKPIKYISMSDFLSEFVFAVQNRQTMDSFKFKYQSYHTLIIDDIQNLNSGAEKTQEEFFAIFNYLFDRKRQIILGSDRPISELPINEKLKSRFVNGYQVEIQAPDEVVRLGILKQKSKEANLQLTDSSIQFISDNFQTDTRALFGCINDIQLYKKTFSLLFVSDEKVKEILENRLHKIKDLDINHEKIIDTVCERYTQSKKDILSKSRKAEYIIPRHICMYLLFEVCNMNKTLIGRIFNTKHTTVISAINRVKEMIKTDLTFKKTVLSIKSQFDHK